MDSLEKEIVESQTGIFLGYLDTFSIDNSSVPAQKILTEIASGNIKTFKEAELKLKSGQVITQYTLTLNKGYFEEKPSSMKAPTIKPETFENLAVLGFATVMQWGDSNVSLPSAIFFGEGVRE